MSIITMFVSQVMVDGLTRSVQWMSYALLLTALWTIFRRAEHSLLNLRIFGAHNMRLTMYKQFSANPIRCSILRMTNLISFFASR